MVIPPGGALSYSSLPRVRRVNSQRWEQSRCPHASLPMAGPDLSRSLTVKSRATSPGGCMGNGLTSFHPKAEVMLSTSLKCRWYRSEASGIWTYFPLGRSLEFFLLRKSMFNKIQTSQSDVQWAAAKTATTSVSTKKRRACFYWYRLASTGIYRDSVPPPAFCIPFLLLYLGFELTLTLDGQWNHIALEWGQCSYMQLFTC